MSDVMKSKILALIGILLRILVLLSLMGGDWKMLAAESIFALLNVSISIFYIM